MRKKFEPIGDKDALMAEAKRYLLNGKQTIAKSPLSKSGETYLDPKYVREGSGIAYLAALKAIDAYLVGRGVAPDQLPKSIEEYWAARKKIPHNGKFTEKFTLAYQNLHIGAYYQGLVSVQVVKAGLNAARDLIEMLEGRPKKS